MKQKLVTFLKSEEGAVTVDWVVLTAAIIGLAFIVMAPFVSTVSEKGTMIGDALGDMRTGVGDN